MITLYYCLIIKNATYVRFSHTLCTNSKANTDFLTNKKKFQFVLAINSSNCLKFRTIPAADFSFSSGYRRTSQDAATVSLNWCWSIMKAPLHNTEYGTWYKEPTWREYKNRY